ncbi:MAG TPA: hypothetical protein VNB91_15975 [Jatrophihabitantaceae bacterium]|nr:hypothetical protein [Jatrophihabitantaceae bacterium]
MTGYDNRSAQRVVSGFIGRRDRVRAAIAMISRLIVAAIAHQVFDEIASERVDGKV